jgi:hypothetical protein
MNRLTVGITVLLVTLAGRGVGQLSRPIAMDKIEPGDLFVLNLSGTILRLHPGSTGLSLVNQFTLPGQQHPADLVS